MKKILGVLALLTIVVLMAAVKNPQSNAAVVLTLPPDMTEVARQDSYQRAEDNVLEKMAAGGELEDPWGIYKRTIKIQSVFADGASINRIDCAATVLRAYPSDYKSSVQSWNADVVTISHCIKSMIGVDMVGDDLLRYSMVKDVDIKILPFLEIKEMYSEAKEKPLLFKVKLATLLNKENYPPIAISAPQVGEAVVCGYMGVSDQRLCTKGWIYNPNIGEDGVAWVEGASVSRGFSGGSVYQNDALVGVLVQIPPNFNRVAAGFAPLNSTAVDTAVSLTTCSTGMEMGKTYFFRNVENDEKILSAHIKFNYETGVYDFESSGYEVLIPVVGQYAGKLGDGIIVKTTEGLILLYNATCER